MEVCYRLVALAAGAKGGISRLAKDKLKVRQRLLLLLLLTVLLQRPARVTERITDAIIVASKGSRW